MNYKKSKNLFLISNRVCNWNKNMGLITQGINPEKEAKFILEEVFEMLDVEKDKIPTLVQETIDKARENKVQNSNLVKDKYGNYSNTALADLLDAAGDIIIFALGFMCKILMKIGTKFTDIPKRIISILSIIMSHNEIKEIRYNADGKLIKSEDFDEEHKDSLPQNLIYNMVENIRSKQMERDTHIDRMQDIKQEHKKRKNRRRRNRNENSN